MQRILSAAAILTLGGLLSTAPLAASEAPATIGHAAPTVTAAKKHHHHHHHHKGAHHQTHAAGASKPTTL